MNSVGFGKTAWLYPLNMSSVVIRASAIAVRALNGGSLRIMA
jgi:hypothetical protein